MAKYRFELDDETGEVTELFGRFISEDQDKAIQYKKSKKESEDSQGEFVWLLFNYCKELFPDISKQSITRLFYVATFVEYNGNRLTNDNGCSFLNKRQLKQKLNLPDKVFQAFWKEMTNRNILGENDDKQVIINVSFFKRGSLDKRCKKDFTRIYCNCIRYIYENTPNIRDHSRLSYIFNIIPFVNRKTNIVCYNPEEMETKKIKPMSVGDFCNIINYDKSQASRLFKDLAKFTVKGKHLMCFVSIRNFEISGMFIIINPEIYYGGAIRGDAQFIFDVCDIKT